MKNPLGFLSGKKRYLGLAVVVLAKLLEGAGNLSEGTADTLETVGGALFGVGYIDSEKRKEAELKKATPK